ncbi:hypothetical protein CSA37_11680 [Candidatus Fermentibacteria bacterium]|nr:MAG: hypothetical protein CSA37_11680 [Candidatus Fermentibacteria bacterium]
MTSPLIKSIERTGKKRLNSFFRAILVRKPEKPSGEPSGILVLRIDNRMGNLVLITSLLRSLEERFPAARIAVLASHKFSAVLKNRGWEIIEMNKKKQIVNPFLLIEFVRRIRSMDFDTVIDASHPYGFSLSTAMLAALTYIPRRIGSPSPEGAGWYTHVPSSWPERTVHESRAIHRLGSVWSSWPEWKPPFLPVSRRRRNRFIGFHAGGKPGRAFSEERLAALAGMAGELAPVRIYWGNEAERLRAENASSGNVQAAPKIPLERLPEELASLTCFVTPDTGPMHLASAVGTPVTAVFQIDNVERFRPLSRYSEALLKPSDEEVIRSLRSVLQAVR